MSDTVLPPVAASLQHLRQRSGLSLEALAVECGYAGASSIQRYFDHRAPERLSPKAAGKFARALVGKGSPPIDPSDFAELIGASLSGPESIGRQALVKILSLNETKSYSKTLPGVGVRVGAVPMAGKAFASFWMRSAPSIDEAREWLDIPLSTEIAPKGRYALQIIGPSLNKTAHEGHYAICQELGYGQQPPPDGKFVHAERERESTGEIEWTIKKVKWGPDGMSLHPDSSDPDHQKPIHMGDPGDNVRIKGVVIGFYKPA